MLSEDNTGLGAGIAQTFVSGMFDLKGTKPPGPAHGTSQNRTRHNKSIATQHRGRMSHLKDATRNYNNNKGIIGEFTAIKSTPFDPNASVATRDKMATLRGRFGKNMQEGMDSVRKASKPLQRS